MSEKKHEIGGGSQDDSSTFVNWADEPVASPQATRAGHLHEHLSTHVGSPDTCPTCIKIRAAQPAAGTTPAMPMTTLSQNGYADRTTPQAERTGCSMSGRVDLGYGEDGHCNVCGDDCPRDCLLSQIRSYLADIEGWKVRYKVLEEARDVAPLETPTQ